MLAGDMNGHVRSSNVGYDGTHGGFGYGVRNADGSRIFGFADALNLVICNTLFCCGISLLHLVGPKLALSLNYLCAGVLITTTSD